jgi:hypothetical protein
MLDLAPDARLGVAIQGSPPLFQQRAVTKLKVHLGKVSFL